MVLAEANCQAEAERAEEAGPSLVAHPHPQGPQPLPRVQPGFPCVEAFLDLSLSPFLPVSLFLPASPCSAPCLSLPLWPSLCPCLPSRTPNILPLSAVATVNDLACRGLDKLEEKLPFLQQPSEMVLAPPDVGSCTGVEVGGRRAASPQTRPPCQCQCQLGTESGFGQLKKYQPH